MITSRLAPSLTSAAIVVAGGSGTRMGQDGLGQSKQWWHLAGQPVVNWSLQALKSAGCSPIVLVVPKDDLELAKRLTGGLVDLYVIGGQSRDQSVKAGLIALVDQGCRGDQTVLIHDAARPGLRPDHIMALHEALAQSPAVMMAIALSDTLTLEAQGQAVSGAPPRAGLYRAQTPQGGRLADLILTHDKGLAAKATDDASALIALGIPVKIVKGEDSLMKLTEPKDFQLVEAGVMSDRITRVGQGFDAHRWGPGERVWLCGVEITHTQTLIGHSDADAGLHALTDAMLGTIGAGDIGDHFPPSDPQWKGASSDRFLCHALDLIKARGGILINVDVTLICEQPKIKPHRQAMRERLAALLGLSLDAVSIKATTTEQMGFTGRGEGLAAQALAVVSLPAPAPAKALS